MRNESLSHFNVVGKQEWFGGCMNVGWSILWCDNLFCIGCSWKWKCRKSILYTCYLMLLDGDYVLEIGCKMRQWLFVLFLLFCFGGKVLNIWCLGFLTMKVWEWLYISIFERFVMKLFSLSSGGLMQKWNY